MLNQKGFDVWSSEYDANVKQSDKNNSYPFAGYNAVLSVIYQEAHKVPGASVLDIGFGTGVLTAKLYDEGHSVTGIDFSEKMFACAKQKMPDASLLLWDFSEGLPQAISDRKFDIILSTYAMHHLTNIKKLKLIEEMLLHLTDKGKILIGDVSFKTKADLDKCRKAAGGGF